MSASEESLSPSYLAEQRVTLSLSAEYAAGSVKARDTVVVDVDVSGCEPEGLVPPLEILVSGPSQQSHQRRALDRIPVSLAIRLVEGGPHVITLKEVAHNRWFGSLHLDVKGPLLTKPRPV